MPSSFVAPGDVLRRPGGRATPVVVGHLGGLGGGGIVIARVVDEPGERGVRELVLADEVARRNSIGSMPISAASEFIARSMA